MTFRALSRPHRLATIAVATVCTLAATLLLGAVPAQAAPAAAASATSDDVVLETLSNRADLVFDGNALVRVTLPEGGDLDDLTVALPGDRDVTSAFAERPDGEIEGVVRGLRVGTNELTARLRDGRGARLTITNHPRGGPIFSGPQLQPWRCQPTATDAQCNQEPEISWLYKSTNPLLDGLQAYDPAKPPKDVATTTTDEGVTVPFVVRVETGYQNRDQYRIAVLWQPGEAWERWSPQEQWNNKLFIPHGGSCGVDHEVGEAPTTDYAGTFDLGIPVVADALGDSPTVALGRGFAMLSTALANTGHNCTVTSEAESLMMAKEHLVETYGDLRYTIGSGCSGGSIAQQTIANAYPGIYQGLVVTCSYPDSLSPGLQFSDYHLLRKYFESSETTRARPDGELARPSAPSEGVGARSAQRLTDGKFWNPAQWAAVEGHLLPLNAVTADEGLFKQAVIPTYPCAGVSDEERYDPATNPGGVRCSIIDGSINVFGPRPESVWTDQEKQIGRGFAGSPLDNTGVQYGLEALRSGAITPEQFVDVNEKIGGLDIDVQPRAERSVADPTALANAYRSGMVNTASNLSGVAIIDHRGPDPGIAHDARWAWAMRDRLTREQGHADNQVIWYGLTPLIGDPSYSKEALLAMDRWLSAVEADSREVPLADKVAQDRPGDLHDRCTQTQGVSSKDGLFLPVADPLVDDLTGGALDGLNGAVNPVLDPALNLVVDPVSDLVCGLGPVSDLVKTDFATPRIVAGDNNYSDNAKCQLKPLRRTDDYGTFGLSDPQWARLETAFPDGVCDYSKPGVGFSETVPWLTYQTAAGSAVYGGTPMGSPPRSEPFGGHDRSPNDR
ncbi:hypothetical protein FB381_0402 [Nocardioides albertanoniae]|uniref:DUF6351 domain-containing protein n=1 Tax=Nocardioides albertanoniae TaxID=1175486 RepID=A0A543A1S9_9ACTN|nr:DUF6351 family protein [Nocardioides albertanoniae]TQL66539.1 hypothetical protein FB381_0402 [Nocardioides albertanoniae]